LKRGKLATVAVMWKAPLESGEGPLPTQTVNKNKKDRNCKRWGGLYTGENKRDMHPGKFYINKACSSRWLTVEGR
jgi:hypothetical protein